MPIARSTSREDLPHHSTSRTSIGCYSFAPNGPPPVGSMVERASALPHSRRMPTSTTSHLISNKQRRTPRPPHIIRAPNARLRLLDTCFIEALRSRFVARPGSGRSCQREGRAPRSPSPPQTRTASNFISVAIVGYVIL